MDNSGPRSGHCWSQARTFRDREVHILSLHNNSVNENPRVGGVSEQVSLACSAHHVCRVALFIVVMSNCDSRRSAKVY